jgi:hypothetical protein
LTVLAFVTIEPDEVPHSFLHGREFGPREFNGRRDDDFVLTE